MSSPTSDYLELLQRSVEKQPNASPEALAKLYGCARSALGSQLRAGDPGRSDDSAVKQRRLLDAALADVEAKLAQTRAAPLASTPALAQASGLATRKQADRPEAPEASLTDILARASREDEAATQNTITQTRLKIPNAVPSQNGSAARPSKALIVETTQSALGECERVLEKLRQRTPGVAATALLSEDGHVIATAVNPEIRESRLSAIIAALLNLGARAGAELNRGAVQEITLRADQGCAALVSAGNGAVLLALTDSSSKLGLVSCDLREAARALQPLLRPSAPLRVND